MKLFIGGPRINIFDYLSQDDLSSYALHIAEEDGEIDPDFPGQSVVI